MTDPRRRSLQLLADGSLLLHIETDRCADVVTRWTPWSAGPATAPAVPGAASITLRASPGESQPQAARPTLSLGGVSCFMRDNHAELRGAAGGWGTIDLGARSAVLHAAAALDSCADVYSMLTIAGALLLSSQGRALVHAGAVVSRAGGVWLLAGDTHAGKSTTVANLMRAGFVWLSDDNVVLTNESGTVGVEGWPRLFNVDRGWARGELTGERVTADPRTMAPHSWRRYGRLAGLLLPRVARDEITVVRPLTAGDALAMLVRQSPWLMADGATAARAFELLRIAAEHPAWALTLGRDSYNHPERLAAALSSLPGW